MLKTCFKLITISIAIATITATVQVQAADNSATLALELLNELAAIRILGGITKDETLKLLRDKKQEYLTKAQSDNAAIVDSLITRLLQSSPNQSDKK